MKYVEKLQEIILDSDLDLAHYGNILATHELVK